MAQAQVPDGSDKSTPLGMDNREISAAGMSAIPTIDVDGSQTSGTLDGRVPEMRAEGRHASTRRQALANLPVVETEAAHLQHEGTSQGGGNGDPSYAAVSERQPTAGAAARHESSADVAPTGHRRRTVRKPGRQSAQGEAQHGEAYKAVGDETRTRGKRRRKSLMGIVSTLLIIVGIGLLAVAGAMWGFTQWRYHQQQVVNDQLAEYADVSENAEQAPTVDWAGLRAINDEVVGWIQVPGTVINYPVYQAEDNNRYLRHTATGEWTWGGQVFMDFENTPPGMIDAQTLIYGHHLKDGTMFQPLSLLDDQARFDETKTIWYVTEEANWELEPLLLYYTQDTDMNARRFRFADEAEFREYLSGLLSRAVTRRADAEQIIAGTRHVLTMSTCNYYDGYGRSLLVAVPKDEAREALAQAGAATA